MAQLEGERKKKCLQVILQDSINKAWSANSVACFRLEDLGMEEEHKLCVRRNREFAHLADTMRDKTNLRQGTDTFKKRLRECKKKIY